MTRARAGRFFASVTVAAVLAGCSGGGSAAGPATETDRPTHGPQAAGGIAPVKTTEQDWAGVAEALGRSGTLSGETVYRVSFPRKDLNVTSQGVPIKAGFSLGSYAVLARYPDSKTMMMGDLVVTEEELSRVTDTLQRNGIDQTAVHKHLLEHEPPVWWVHVHAEGTDPVTIAKGVKAALDVTATPPGGGPAPPAQLELDTAAIDAAMGTKGRNDGGIYKFSFARTETVTSHGKILPPAMGVTTAINFQPTGGGKAAVNGDFAMTGDEVQQVIQALRAGRIEIVEVHNHALNDEPRLFYMHFWANDDAVALARTLKQAVDMHNVKPAG